MDLIDFGLAGPPREFVVPERRYVVGVDLGQSLDPTAVCVLEHRTDPSGKWEAITASRSREIPAVHYDVRHLERQPLRTPYPAVVDHVASLLERPPLAGNCELVGKHDDLVLAVAIALWWAARPVPDVGMFKIKGIY